MLENISKILPVSITTQALLLGVTVGALTYYTFFKKKYKLPPGPWALPLVGNLLAINDSSSAFYQKLMNWRKDYGPVICVYLGPMRCITLNDANVAHEALVKKSAEFAGRLHSYSIGYFSDGYIDLVFSDVTKAWKIQRKIALQGLRQYLSGNALENKLLESSLKVINEIKKQNGQPFNIQKYIGLLVFHLLNGVCFNKCCEIDDETFLEELSVLDRLNDEFGVGFWEDVVPPLRYFPTAKFRNFEKMLNVFKTSVDYECRRHLDKSSDELDDFTSYLIEAREQAIKEDPEVENLISERHVFNTVRNIFMAGTDTTRQTLSWTILLLVNHPEIQENVQAEVDKVIGLCQCPTVADRAQLPYTEAVLHESMRFRPVAPMSLPHKTLCDTTVGGYDAPKGTTIFINTYAIHHDPNWWKDPEVFRPERFLDEDGSLAPKPLAWLPFSAGRRNCLGETIAKPELHLFLAILLRNFSFSSSDGQKLDLKVKGVFAAVPPMVDVVATPRL